jgi:hypothetical protein
MVPMGYSSHSAAVKGAGSSIGIPALVQNGRLRFAAQPFVAIRLKQIQDDRLVTTDANGKFDLPLVALTYFDQEYVGTS